jgi:hypothetical protein
MRICRLSLLFVLLVGVDFACPLLPGAVAFEVEQSVDASRRISVPPDHTVAMSHRTTEAERVILADSRMLIRKPSAGVRSGDQAPRGRSSTFLAPEPSSSLLEDQ